MQLYYFLAVILSLSFGSLPASNQSFAQALAFTALVVLAWWVLSYLSVRLVTRLIDQGEVSVDVGYDWFHRQTECFRWFSLALVLLCLGGFGLGRNLDQVPLVRHSLAAQAVVLLSPALAMMAGLWAGEYLFGSGLSGARPRLRSCLAWVVSALRCSVGWLLLPILGIMLMLDLASAVSLGGEIPAWTGWAGVGVSVLLGIPLLVRKVFPTKPLDPATKSWIEAVVLSAGMRSCRIVMWDTGGRTHNAMIAGLLGRFRVLLLSDRLVDELNRQQLAMVILHEVAHAKRFHIPLRIVALVPAWLAGAAIDRGLASAAALQADASQLAAGSQLAAWAGTIGSAVSILATVLILRWVSYRSEFDADRIACRLAPEVAKHCAEVPATEAGARLQLAAALLHVTAESDASRQASWLHPGIVDRIDAFAPGWDHSAAPRASSPRATSMA